MKEQRSFQDETAKLYLVPTPIGNLADMTHRAIEILQSVDWILAEDTRTSKVLLKHYDISRPLKSYHQHNENLQTDFVLNELRNNKNLALISDAGTPLISDPGHILVKRVIEEGFSVVSIPGPSAGIVALIAANIEPAPHLFYGFLPSKTNDRKKTLKTLKTLPYTIVFYEAPHRIKSMLKDLYDSFGERNIAVARELTKRYESYWRGPLSRHIDIPDLKGEIVVVVSGSNDEITWNDEDIIHHIQILLADGLSEMEAIKNVAKARKMKKNDVYMAFQSHKQHLKNHTRSDFNG